MFLSLDPELSLIQKSVQLFEYHGNHLCVFVPDVSQPLACLSKVVSREELVWAESELQVIYQFLHAPAVVKFRN